jgi:hypothetical protein
MRDEIHMHDAVALLEETVAKRFGGSGDLILRRGQVGTVVMTYDGTAFEVEFADLQGRTYALLPLPSAKLMTLKYDPRLVPA